MFGRIAVRTFASKAPAAAVQPPIKLFGINGRYATALYVSAAKADLLNKVDEEVSAFTDLMQKQANFTAYLKNPTISRADKTAKLSTLLDEKKFSHVTRNFFVTMAANGKLGDVEKITGNFVELMQAAKGTVVATITSAEPLNKKTLSTIQTAVSGLVGKGGNVEFKTRVNETIMGGLQVQIGDKFLDLSLASRLQQVSRELDSIAV